MCARPRRAALRVVPGSARCALRARQVEQSASKLGVPPQQLADQNSAAFRSVMEAMGISFDDFIRTTDDYHERQVQALVVRRAARRAHPPPLRRPTGHCGGGLPLWCGSISPLLLGSGIASLSAAVGLRCLDAFERRKSGQLPVGQRPAACPLAAAAAAAAARAAPAAAARAAPLLAPCRAAR